MALWSRLGKPHQPVPQVVETLQRLMRPGTIWDGELYCHGVPFQMQVSWIKRTSPGTSRLYYCVFDEMGEGPFDQRYERLNQTFYQRYETTEAVTEAIEHGPVRLVRPHPVASHLGVQQLHDQFVQEGYEGIMVRHGSAPYERDKRSQSLLKYKDFQDQEFRIVGMVENVGKAEGTGCFVCTTDAGETFKAMPRGTDEIRRAYWDRRQQLLGKQLTVRFQAWSDSVPPKPRFPVGIAVRDYEGEYVDAGIQSVSQ